MSTKLFVGRLTEGTSSDDILSLFRKYGTVTECTVLGNYGFVHMSSESEAKAALAELDGFSVKGNHIHVELSTVNTQGRKKRMDHPSDGRSGGGRYEPYPPHRHAEPPVHRAGGAVVIDRDRQAREDYASEQVKDLLELYFRDPYAFDQYAKTYYYGERAERERARSAYERRPVEVVYAPVVPRREDDILRGAATVAKASSSYAAVDYALARSSSTSTLAVRDDRYRVSAAANSLYPPGGRL